MLRTTRTHIQSILSSSRTTTIDHIFRILFGSFLFPLRNGLATNFSIWSINQTAPLFYRSSTSPTLSLRIFSNCNQKSHVLDETFILSDIFWVLSYLLAPVKGLWRSDLLWVYLRSFSKWRCQQDREQRPKMGRKLEIFKPDECLHSSLFILFFLLFFFNQ